MLGTLAAGTPSQVSAGRVPALSWDVLVPTIPCGKGSVQPQNLPQRNQPIMAKGIEAGIVTWAYLANSLRISFLSFLLFCFSLSYTLYRTTLSFRKLVYFSLYLEVLLNRSHNEIPGQLTKVLIIHFQGHKHSPISLLLPLILLL